MTRENLDKLWNSIIIYAIIIPTILVRYILILIISSILSLATIVTEVIKNSFIFILSIVRGLCTRDINDAFMEHSEFIRICDWKFILDPCNLWNSFDSSDSDKCVNSCDFNNSVLLPIKSLLKCIN